MVKVTGSDAHVKRLEAMAGPMLVDYVGRVLFVGADAIKATAQHSITDGSVSGKFHVPSEPGEPPNSDTHDLDRQIESALVAPLHAQVTSNSRHAEYMEFGTSHIEERPYMRPATQKERPEIVANIAAAVNTVNALAKASAGGK